MAQTLDCVGLFIKLTHKTERETESTRLRLISKTKCAGRIAKQFLTTMADGDDAGVSDHMESLRNLVVQEGQLATTVILTSVLGIRKDMGTVQGTVNNVSEKLSLVQKMITDHTPSLSQSRVDQLKKYFCVTLEPWNESFRSRAECCVTGTGSWLLDHSTFAAWTNTEVGAPPLFAIEAGSNSGKTYLATFVITHLHERALVKNPQPTIAFYYIDQSSKDLTAAAIIRAIAYQLCTQNTRFSELSAPIIEEMMRGKHDLSSSSAIDLWAKLIVEVSCRLADSSFYIVLDGLNLIADAQLRILSEALASSNKAELGLRILLTGNANCLVHIPRFAHDSLSKISLGSGYPNRKDVVLVTEAELARCDYFSGNFDSPELREDMASVRNLLVKAVDGDYYRLHMRVDEIRHLSFKSEIDRVLSRASDDRETTIKRHFVNLAVRVSPAELAKFRYALHFLAVMNILGVSMPHSIVLEQYCATEQDSAASVKRALSADPGLISIDANGRLSLATNEISTFLLPTAETNQTTIQIPQHAREKQLEAIKQFLNATFLPSSLKEHGIDDEFFESRSRLSGLSNFIVERNVATTKVVIRLIDCLGEMSTKQREHNTCTNQPLHIFSDFVREVLPALMPHIDSSRLDDELRTDLGAVISRVFFEDTFSDTLWSLGAISQAVTTQEKTERYFDAVYHIITHPSVISRLECKPDNQSWATEIQRMANANDLKIATSKRIAKKWLLSRAFWTDDDMKTLFLWFSTIPTLGLEDKNENDRQYDHTRTIGWFTPRNWSRIKAWVKGNVEIGEPRDLAIFDIQTAAVLLCFGDKSHTPRKLLNPHLRTEWLANVWNPEALSRTSTYSDAYSAVEDCLDVLVECKVDRATMVKVIDSFLFWMGHWGGGPIVLKIRERILELNKLIPGIVSTRMLAEHFLHILESRDGTAAMNYLQEQYRSGKQLVLETFVRQAGHHYFHIALSQTAVNDLEGSWFHFVQDLYSKAVGFCDSKEMLYVKDTGQARVKLAFWLGRLFFTSNDPAKLSQAIAVWENLLNSFRSKTSTGDLDVLLPIVIHLCSAYLQVLPQKREALEMDHIILQVMRLREVAKSSQSPIAYKINFRISLCLARIHVVRGDSVKAHRTLREHAKSAFAMLSQRNNKPLFSIGWLYLASILTMLGEDEDRQKWAWSKVRLYQPTRWRVPDFYTQESNCGDNPPLNAETMKTVEAIKKGEEYFFYDGVYLNHVGYTWPDDTYLPSFATMTCEGRACRGSSTYKSGPLRMFEGVNFNTPWPPTRNYSGEPVAFRVCRDCLLSKLCGNCCTALREGSLPLMGCSPEHSALTVSGSLGTKDDAISYSKVPSWASDKDMEIVAEESKKWEST